MSVTDHAIKHTAKYIEKSLQFLISPHPKGRFSAFWLLFLPPNSYIDTDLLIIADIRKLDFLPLPSLCFVFKRVFKRKYSR